MNKIKALKTNKTPTQQDLQQQLVLEKKKRILVEKELKEKEKLTRSIFDSSLDAIFTTDNNFRLTEFNKAACEMYGYKREEIIGKDFAVLFAFTIENQKKVREVFLQRKHSFSTEIKNKRSNGKVFSAYLSASIIKNEKGNNIGIMGILRDISNIKRKEESLKKSLQEKDILIKEVHHRVKNNLQVISSIISLQASYITDEKVKEMLNESQNRIISMSFIHESLYRNKDFSSIDFKDYVNNLCQHIARSYGVKNSDVKVELVCEKVKFSLDNAIPCGLIINELVSNAYKYAFPNNKKGNIKINIVQQTKKANIIISDDGVGLPHKFNLNKTNTLGLQLVNTLIHQLNGKLIINKVPQGTSYSISVTI